MLLGFQSEFIILACVAFGIATISFLVIVFKFLICYPTVPPIRSDDDKKSISSQSQSRSRSRSRHNSSLSSLSRDSSLKHVIQETVNVMIEPDESANERVFSSELHSRLS